MKPRIFLLSPAYAGGERAKLLLNGNASFELAVRVRTRGAPLAEVFSFLSGLYFRGKVAYTQRFASPPAGGPGSLIITAGRGLVHPETIVTLDDLRQIAAVPIDESNPLYREPLDRDAQELTRLVDPAFDVILLGSIATPKYVSPLLEVFGERLLFPSEFVGRGDMSRGGLMLRCVLEETELTYAPVANAVRRGPRPPKLPRIKG